MNLLLMYALLLAFSHQVACQQSSETSGTFFREITDHNAFEKENPEVNIISSFFHQCSMNKCKFITKTTKGKKYKKTTNLPSTNEDMIAIKSEGSQSLDCKHAFEQGERTSGIFNSIYGTFPVFCDLSSTNQWWIVFQRRISSDVDFYRGWADYKQGFGDLTGNFWLGLDKLHTLAAPGKSAKLRVEIKHISNPSKLYFAQYSSFSIEGEADKFRLKVSGYSGNAEDGLAFHNNMQFSTKDSDNDISPFVNCAEVFLGAWWYNGCLKSNLNGMFPPDAWKTDPKYMTWFTLFNRNSGIIFSEMKLTYAQ